MVQAIKARCGEALVVDGAAEANALGLSTHVPPLEVCPTSGSQFTPQAIHATDRVVREQACTLLLQKNQNHRLFDVPFAVRALDAALTDVLTGPLDEID